MTILASTTHRPNRCLAHSPRCNTCSSSEMLCQSHWKTQIKGLMKRQFVLPFAHPARVCSAEKWAMIHPFFFMHWASISSPEPQRKGSLLQDPSPIEPAFLRGMPARSFFFSRRWTLLDAGKSDLERDFGLRRRRQQHRAKHSNPPPPRSSPPPPGQRWLRDTATITKQQPSFKVKGGGGTRLLLSK